MITKCACARVCVPIVVWAFALSRRVKSTPTNPATHRPLQTHTQTHRHTNRLWSNLSFSLQNICFLSTTSPQYRLCGNFNAAFLRRRQHWIHRLGKTNTGSTLTLHSAAFEPLNYFTIPLKVEFYFYLTWWCFGKSCFPGEANLFAALVVGMSQFGLWELQQAHWCSSSCFDSVSTGTVVGYLRRPGGEQKHLWTKPITEGRKVISWGTWLEEFRLFYVPDCKLIANETEPYLFVFQNAPCVWLHGSSSCGPSRCWLSSWGLSPTHSASSQSDSLLGCRVYKKISAAACWCRRGPRLWTMTSIVSPSPQSDSEITHVQHGVLGNTNQNVKVWIKVQITVVRSGDTSEEDGGREGVCFSEGVKIIFNWRTGI